MATEGRAAMPPRTLSSLSSAGPISNPESDPLLDLLGFSPAQPDVGPERTPSVAALPPASSPDSPPTAIPKTTDRAGPFSANSTSALQQVAPVVSSQGTASSLLLDRSQAQSVTQALVSRMGAVSNAVSAEAAHLPMPLPVSSHLQMPVPALPTVPAANVPQLASPAVQSMPEPVNTHSRVQQQQQLAEAQQECSLLRQQLKVLLLLRCDTPVPFPAIALILLL